MSTSLAKVHNSVAKTRNPKRVEPYRLNKQPSTNAGEVAQLAEMLSALDIEIVQADPNDHGKVRLEFPDVDDAAEFLEMVGSALVEDHAAQDHLFDRIFNGKKYPGPQTQLWDCSMDLDAEEMECEGCGCQAVVVQSAFSIRFPASDLSFVSEIVKENLMD